jgi:hypothetical protein
MSLLAYRPLHLNPGVSLVSPIRHMGCYDRMPWASDLDANGVLPIYTM